MDINYSNVHGRDVIFTLVILTEVKIIKIYPRFIWWFKKFFVSLL